MEQFISLINKEDYMKIKKLVKLCSMVMGMVLCFNSVTAYASAAEQAVKIDETYELDVYEDDSAYDEVNDYLIQHGREVLENTKKRSSVTLSGIKRLVQSDPRWSSVVMQKCGKTIGGSGCALTSFTMVRNLLSGTNDTPADVNAKLGDAACPLNWETAREKYGYKILTRVTHQISNEVARLHIVGAIDEYSRPAIVGMSGNGEHFVVANGYTSDGDIIICDPSARNYTRLSQYYNNGYYVDRIYVYSK